MSVATKGNQKLVLVGIGSNINPENNIQRALTLLNELSYLYKRASIWQTPAVGSKGPDYLNSAAIIKTTNSQEQIKNNVLSIIEQQLDRIRSKDRYMDRTIDLDILVYDQTIIDKDLWTQAHIAAPAAQLMPDLQNPHTGEKLSRAATRLLPGTSIIERIDLS